VLWRRLFYVSANRFPYVETKKLHKSQKVLENQLCTVALHIYTNRELKAKILEYGADVEVLAPDSLRKEIAETLLRASAWYEVKGE
jgi:predicted DNA-binding transcriptional regulator YafY